ncbi:hypothetical protein GCM10007216_06540 [Thalassobacillus devorans]|uniref:Activator of Hsp90 ATPase homologue 1/2-like C-terminal domain-containing protein n=1 Tax=Thalassobacillus devorans TaxID=279813 RepID=A0ABQ1NJA9_9BACI|nr:SRPBCC domain-containing protein [Thalassobacillus devorans]NIK27564.1 uncharacterized protein YndB with AHSA1/START domain [Thalassobacillus devorans]GGC78728.1 hypothetical protein GCM10007216_06540 [Thalassobacillus devorans]
MAVNKESLEKKVEGRNLVIERVFKAPREKVFLAYSDSEQLAAWWGPQGWNTENKRYEFQPEGVWHYCMRCHDQEQGDFYGKESWGKTVFQEIKAPEKIVYTDVFSDEQGNEAEGMPKVVVTLNFKDQGDETKLVTRSEFASEKELQSLLNMGVVEGVASQFVCLDDHLKKLNE